MNEAQNNDVTNGEQAAVQTDETVTSVVRNDLNVEEQTVSKLTPEMEQEAKLLSKYPNPQKPGGSAFIQKMLHRGSKKYFDSGDYNMAKSKNKQKLGNINANQANRPVNTIAMTTTPLENATSQPNADTTPQTPGTVEQTAISSPLSMSPVVTHESSHLVTTTPNAASSNDNVRVTTPILYNNINNNSQNITPSNHHLNHHYLNTSHSNSSPLSSSISSNNLLNPHFHHNQLSTSMSTQSISMLSSSNSNDRISNIHLNPTNPTCILDNEEIGHAIPTPECLPQSRKHSIVQSKLATPRLSSS